MKQRVAIARGMAMEPDILLMDEPFAALDALTRRKMQDELLQLWEDTRFTVLFVTHSIPEAVRIGNRILLLSPHPGQVKAELNSDGTDPNDPAPACACRTASTACCSATATSRRRWPMSSAPLRPEYVREQVAEQDFGVVAKPLTRLERIYGNGLVRKLAILVVLALIWQLYARYLNNDAGAADLRRSTLQFIDRAHRHRRAAGARRRVDQVLLQGYTIGLALALVLHHPGDDHPDRQRPARDPDRRCSTRCRPSRCCRWR
jgi:ABC-type sulfate/molybdate transport systems ATPase subunit